MAINILCMSCKSSMKLGNSKCHKCGEKLTGKNRMYRIRVKLPSGKWKTKTAPTLNMATKIELQYKTKGMEEDTGIQFEALTLPEIWSEYLKWAKFNKRSWETDSYLWDNHIKQHLNGIKINRVVPHHVQTIVNSMYSKRKTNGKPYAPATVKQTLVLMKHLFNWSTKQGYFYGINPCNSIEMPRFDNSVTNPLSKDGLKSLMAVLNSWENERAVLVIKFALYSGKRRGEILSLNWNNVDFENRLLTLNATNTKAMKTQTVPLNGLCMDILERCKELQVSDLVFPCSTGIYFSGFTRTWERIRKRAGLKGFRFHDLRHTYASYLASSGKVDIYTLKELLGHSDIKMTQRYAHLINGALRNGTRDLIPLHRHRDYPSQFQRNQSTTI